MKATELPQSLSSACLEKTAAEASELLLRYNPSYQMEICDDEKLCITGDYPTLAEVKRDYGKKIPIAWLIPQLQNLSWYCGVRDKLDQRQLEECAYIIATEFWHLKVSEIMLFFHRFKAGRYGKLFGTIDPLMICRSLREFVKERDNAIDEYEHEENRKKFEQHQKECVSWEEWCNQTGQSERINQPILTMFRESHEEERDNTAVQT